MTTCSVADCNRPTRSRGWCEMHYCRWKRHRDISWERQSQKLLERPPCSVVGCSNESQKRGWCSKHYRRWQLLSHLVLLLDGRPRPPAPRNHALHSCDHPWCFNPAHLRWGSNKQNVQDAVRRDRNVKGERVVQAKLTSEQVLAIRKDDRTQQKIAETYGICQQNVCRIKQGAQWKHL